MDIKTKILKVKGDWQDVVDSARATVDKPPLGKEPSKKFKRQILIAEHSVIRALWIRWIWMLIPSWISVHFARHHEGWEKWITTQRNDRQAKYDREEAPQDAPVNYTGEANCQGMINVGRARLCYKASPQTRAYYEDFKRKVAEVDEDIAWSMVPHCIYRGGCQEPQACGFYKTFLEKHPEITRESSIMDRYDAYNSDFFKKG